MTVTCVKKAGSAFIFTYSQTADSKFKAAGLVFVLAMFSAGCSAPVEVSQSAAVASPAPMVEDPPPLTQCPQEIGLCFRVEPADASLNINQTDIGSIKQLAGEGLYFHKTEPGIYQVTLTREGFQTWRTEVSVQDGLETIDVILEAKPTAD